MAVREWLTTIPAIGWVMKYLTVQYNAGAGVFVGTHDILSYSCLRDNGEYGFQGLGYDTGEFSATHLTIDHNEVTGNNTWNWESRNGGCGCSGADKFWNVADVSLTDNYIHNNHGPGIWADTDNANFNVAGNYVSDNDAEAVIYETSYNLRLVHNTFVRNALVDGPGLGGFPDPAVYISESGGDSRAPDSYGASIDISGNTFTNNWAGVVLWENANRYCSSGANTSTGYCTLVDPSVANDQQLRQTQPHSNRALHQRLPLENSECAGQRQLLHLRPGGHRPGLHPSEVLRVQRHLQRVGFLAAIPRHGCRKPHHLRPEQPFRVEYL